MIGGAQWERKTQGASLVKKIKNFKAHDTQYRALWRGSCTPILAVVDQNPGLPMLLPERWKRRGRARNAKHAGEEGFGLRAQPAQGTQSGRKDGAFQNPEAFQDGWGTAAAVKAARLGTSCLCG